MSTQCKDTSWIIQAALDQLTPDMVHVCLLPSSTFVKVTRIVHVVRSEIAVRADEGPACPPGSKDLHPGAVADSCEQPPAVAAPRRERPAPRRSRARSRKR